LVRNYRVASKMLIVAPAVILRAHRNNLFGRQSYRSQIIIGFCKSYFGIALCITC